MTKIAGSKKSAHQQVHLGEQVIGEIWREKVNVVVSKVTAPRVMAERWRWFGKQAGVATVLGRGTRAAMLVGPGFKTRDAVITVLTDEASRGTA
ncbi:hypothetical protein [Paraburkholderia humisilvae]|uniref:hypothetical protein n=1 Tax=Paraburkholderia humisilvae TaxID=627669 RepID=UPI001583EE61|nr:hypothetical protein [Paraburkholderia humisilvae]